MMSHIQPSRAVFQTGRSPAKIKRPRERFTFLEQLESRVLLTTFTWTDDHDTHVWNDAGNWDNGSGGTIPEAVPDGATDDVVINKTADISVDISPTVHSLTLTGASVIHFTFGAGQNLLVQETAGDANSGKITMQQIAGHNLGVSFFANNPGSGTVDAKSLSVTGDDTGSSHLTINTSTKLRLTADLDADAKKFTLTDNGIIEAVNAIFKGKTLPASGVPDPSALSVANGSMLLSGNLRVGGLGKVDMTVDAGVLTANTFYLPNISTFDAKNGSVVNINDRVYIGDPNGAFIVLPQLLPMAGGQFTIESGATATVFSAISVNGGTFAQLNVLSGGNLETRVIVAESGGYGAGAKLHFAGESTMVNVTSYMEVGGSGPALLLMEDHAALVVSNVNGPGDLTVASDSLTPVEQLSLKGQSSITAHQAYFGTIAGGSATKTATINITGASTLTVTNDIDVGDGHSLGSFLAYVPFWGSVNNSTYFNLDAGSTVTCTTFNKNIYANVNGRGTIVGAIVAAGSSADFWPGDEVVPTGTLTLDGDLNIDNNPAFGMTLDAYLKPTAGASNLLHITGTAQIAGTIAFFFPAGTTTSSFHSGDTFTLLTADGGLTGTFSNLPYDPDHNGVLVNGSSPIHILSVGLRWQVQYTSTSLILKVIPVSPATSLHTTNIATAPSNQYIGARSVSFAWTNHDPDILYSILEVQDYDTGNYFAAARVEGNASSLTFNPAGNPGPYGFQVGGNYNVRIRTVTTAGAAYSAVCNFEVPDFAPADSQDSPAIEFIPDPYNEAKYSVKLTGINTQDQYTVLAIGSLFPDRHRCSFPCNPHTIPHHKGLRRAA